MGFLWQLGSSKVARGLGDHFATTVSYLSPKCALSVFFQFSPFRFPKGYRTLAEEALEYEH